MKIKNIDIHRSIGGACAGAALLLALGASAQNLFVTTYSGDDIYEYTPGGVQSTFASGLNYPVGIVFNSAGDLFVANSADNAYAGSTEYGNITEIAPNGTHSAFASGVDPQGLAMNSAGDLFQVDYRSGNIYEYTPNGAQSTFATGFSLPLSVAVNSAGDVFVGAGYGDGNGYITEIAPNGTQSLFASGLNFPHGLVFNSAGDLLVSEEDSGTIYQFTPKGVESTFANLNVNSLGGLTLNNAGDLFAASSSGSGSIFEITPGGAVSTFASPVPGLADDIAFQPVPEPSAFALIGAGAVIIFACYRARKSAVLKS
jgi:hypothetical protein